MQQSWKNQVMDFMRIRNLEEDRAEDRYLWHLGVDGRATLGCIDPNNIYLDEYCLRISRIIIN